MIAIRRAEEKDIPQVLDLLGQILEVHAVIRPDLFISGTVKYTGEELKTIFKDELRPVFVAENEEGKVVGYCFCILQKVEHANNLRDSLTLYMDDLCVDEAYRGRHIGKSLCDYAMAYGRRKGCYDVTLNVWEGNDGGLAFYRKMGFGVRKTMMEKIL